MQMCYLFMEENGATLPSGFLRDPFGIPSGSIRDSFGIHSGFLRDSFGIPSGCCILCLKNMLIDKNKSADGTNHLWCFYICADDR